MSAPGDHCAFPIIAETHDHVIEIGMTLRDYFAAKAMQAMITTANGARLNGIDGMEPVTAMAAYKMADAMLEARAPAAREGKG